MNKLILALQLIFLTGHLFAARGEVILDKGDYCVIETGCSYTVMEWYGGACPSEGDEIVGELNSYGFKDVYNLSRRAESHVYIEDYLLDEDDAIEMLYELSN